MFYGQTVNNVQLKLLTHHRKKNNSNLTIGNSDLVRYNIPGKCRFN